MKRIKWFLMAMPIACGIILFFTVIKNEKGNNQWEIAYKEKQIKKKKGIKGDKLARIKEIENFFHERQTKFGKTSSEYPSDYLIIELQKALSNRSFKSSSEETEWIHRGPRNVAGRTRSILVDKRDKTHNTWFSGAASGGLWKTTDGGDTWTNLSYELPYQSISAIEQSDRFPEVMLFGTGESFAGSLGFSGGGIFKSSDGGDSWEHITSTSDSLFKYINELWIHPQDTNVFMVATTYGVFKTSNGGNDWDTLLLSNYTIDDLKVDPTDENTIYATERFMGVLRSQDMGITWDTINEGIYWDNGRFELAISPVNPSRLFVCCGSSGRGSDLYFSNDKGDNWNYVENTAGEKTDYLGGQSTYNNTVVAHPYDENTVYVAGVNIWKVIVNGEPYSGKGIITSFKGDNVDYIQMISFNGNVYPGLSTGDQENAANLEESDFVSIEIRFGTNVSQKAHRFTVPYQATSGVPPSDYTYQDYIEVPFQVWDVTNNRQLMCSFRDQEKDGEFNLYTRTGDAYGQLGREYIFINAIPYNDSVPNDLIAEKGGHTQKMIYFLWPSLTPYYHVGDWYKLNAGKLIIDYNLPSVINGEVRNVSDAYRWFSKKNTYNQSSGYGTSSVPGFHPDHHVMKTIKTDTANKRFSIICGNDGGVGFSSDNGNTFTQVSKGITSTQFYGVAKKPYRNEYIGGTQDNGTWQSKSYEEASMDNDYIFRLGGDGFEAVWHSQDSNRIMGSGYYNGIFRSLDHGKTWYQTGLNIENDGPFITKLTLIPSRPETVFAVGKEGLWKTTNFGFSNWRMIKMAEGWNAPGLNVTNHHQVKYSIANDSIIWTGAASSRAFNWKIFVSEDGGNTFSSVSYPNPAMDLFISGIETHPTEPSTSYLIYSGAKLGKVFRTTDMGWTWEDITGFENGASTNGFPDVPCYSLVVFPDNSDRIWVGTEIGIMESLDNGASWNILNSNLPTIPVYKMFIQDNQVVAGTYGGGIWTYQFAEAPTHPDNNNNNSSQIATTEVFEISVYPNPFADQINIELPQSSKVKEVKILDVNGRLIINSKVNNSEQLSLDLSEQAVGSYILFVVTESHTYTKRLVKSR